jgi:ADP-ribose pyrophosphatase
MKTNKTLDVPNFQVPKFEDAPKVFSGRRFDVHTFQIKGRQGKSIQMDVVVHPGAVVILPLVDEDHLLLIRNHRYAVGQTLWELPAGTLEPKEQPLETAKRELAEETGYQAQHVEHLTTFFTTPGICNEVMYAYVARQLSFVGQHLDANEQITVEQFSWQKVLTMIRNGIIADAKTLTTLLYYQTTIRLV